MSYRRLMADPENTDSADHGLILDLTIKRSNLFVASRSAASAEDVNDNRYISAQRMEWEDESCLSVPIMCTPSDEYGTENELQIITRISNAESATLSDNRASYRYMAWEDENRSQSVPILGTTTRDGDAERMLPFKKRRSHLQSRMAVSGDLQVSPVIGLDGSSSSDPEQTRQLAVVDVGRRVYVSGNASQTDGVTVLVENMAAMHTDPRQQQQQQQQKQHDPDECDKYENGASGVCTLRGRGLHVIEPNLKQQTSGNGLSEPVSTPAVCDNNCDSGIDVSEEECKLITKPDEDGDLPIHIAAVQGEKEIVARLIAIMLKNNVSIDQTNDLKQTPLHLATITEHAEIMKLLLEGGASPNTPDRKGNMCCHLAVKKNAVNCLQTIIEYSKEKVDINAKNFEGMTPLHQAVKLGHLHCINFLIQCDAEINIVDGKSGKTPLYLAFECNKKEAADLLLLNGADINIPTYSGCTLIQAANHRGQKLLNDNFRIPQARGFSKVTRRKQRVMKSHT